MVMHWQFENALMRENAAGPGPGRTRTSGLEPGPAGQGLRLGGEPLDGVAVAKKALDSLHLRDALLRRVTQMCAGAGVRAYARRGQ